LKIYLNLGLPHLIMFDYKHNMEDESDDYKSLLPVLDYQSPIVVTEHIGNDYYLIMVTLTKDGISVNMYFYNSEWKISSDESPDASNIILSLYSEKVNFF
jgi:hypothetical protein